MSLFTSLLIVPFILLVLGSAILAASAWKRSRSPGSFPFAVMMVATIIWLLTSAVEMAMRTQADKVVWGKLSYLGIALVPTFWLIFTVEYTRQGQELLQRWSSWLAVIPAITIFLVMTNEWHHLIWTSIYPSYQDVLILIYRHGLWFTIFVIYSYVQLMTGCWLIIQAIIKSPKLYKRQSIPLLVGGIVPVVANLLYIFRESPIGGLDPTPYAFAVSSVFFAVSLFRRSMFELIPVAREAILESIGEGYLVFDMQQRLVDANILALNLLQLSGKQTLYTPLGQPADQVLANWPTVLDLLISDTRSSVELALKHLDPPTYLEAHLTPWYDHSWGLFSGSEKPNLSGKILLLRDITHRKQVEDQLRESEKLYRLLVNTSPVGILLLDNMGKITFASPREYALHGMPADYPFIGQFSINWVHPEDREAALAQWQPFLNGTVNQDPQEFRMLRTDGSLFWGEVHSTPVIGKDGMKQGWLALTRDITQRKELEIRLQQNLEQQTFVNDLLQVLYRPQSWDEALGIILERTGLYVHANRVYLCEDNLDRTETWVTHEWACPSPIRNRLAAREGLLMRYSQYPSWQKQMESNNLVRLDNVENAPEDLIEFMNIWEVQSILAFPIFGNVGAFGFLGIDSDEPRLWASEEVDLLWNVCRLISGAVTQMQIEEAEHHERVMADALRNLTSALNSTLNLDEVLDRVLANLEIVVPHNSASIAMLDDDNRVRFVRWRGFAENIVTRFRNTQIKLGDLGTFRWMAETCEPLLIFDTLTDKRWIVLGENNQIRSYVGVPIQNKGRLVGFINLDSNEPDYFTTEHADRLRAFADSVALAIENARLYNAAKRNAEEMSILYRIGLTLTAGLEMNQVLISLLEQCRQVLPIDVFYVALYDKDTGVIQHPLYCEGDIFRQIEAFSIFVSPGLSGEIIRSRQTLYLPDTLLPEIEARYKLQRPGGRSPRSYLGVPLIVLDQVVGVISIQNYQPHAYEPEQIRLLETIATQAAIAVQNARLYDQMKQMAIRDAVTQLYTRRHFIVTGRSEVDRAQRYHRALSVLMVDIDHFKRVNDTFGHNIGDQVLRVVAEAGSQALRATDIVGRWGGEEFVIVLPEADRDGALMIAERIRRIVSETEIPTASRPIKVTVSIGAAVLGGERNTLESLVDFADRAMYMAKQAGRNQVRLWED